MNQCLEHYQGNNYPQIRQLTAIPSGYQVRKGGE